MGQLVHAVCGYGHNTEAVLCGAMVGMSVAACITVAVCIAFLIVITIKTFF